MISQEIPKRLNLGCGRDIHPDAYNVDLWPMDGVDDTLDLNQYPWDLPRDHFHEIRAYHVFEHLDDVSRALLECRKLLVGGGRLIVKVPIGTNAVADPDHENMWTWQTPEFYTGERHWDTDVGLRVVEKSVNMHSQYPHPMLRRLQRLKWWAIKQIGGYGEWCMNQPAMSGTMTVIFQA